MCIYIYIVKCSNIYFLNDLPKLWNQIFFMLYLIYLILNYLQFYIYFRWPLKKCITEVSL
jgi:hypothetical protein